ncbi:MAG: DUF126 domain-containing protein [Halieaceae bacterium]|jgi:predicted aconitase with swiveling domain|nr:DUF126 domain-containing protein [Halieaceae bacterium]
MADHGLSVRRYCGSARPVAPVYWLETLGFWGGVDVETGVIVDSLHARRGLCLHGAICLVGTTKGSTAGPGALLEWVCGSQPPAALLTTGPNLSVAVAAQALALAGPAPAVLGELAECPPLAVLAAWDGVVARFEGDRIRRVG